jgi:hypothetical protein
MLTHDEDGQRITFPIFSIPGDAGVLAGIDKPPRFDDGPPTYTLSPAAAAAEAVAVAHAMAIVLGRNREAYDRLTDAEKALIPGMPAVMDQLEARVLKTIADCTLDKFRQRYPAVSAMFREHQQKVAGDFLIERMPRR